MVAAWDECEAIARSYDPDTGREIVVRCDLGRHEAPGDSNVEHHDPGLGINWRYDDEGPRFDE